MKDFFEYLKYNYGSFLGLSINSAMVLVSLSVISDSNNVFINGSICLLFLIRLISLVVLYGYCNLKIWYGYIDLKLSNIIKVIFCLGMDFSIAMAISFFLFF